jgi:hypothetical protein
VYLFEDLEEDGCAVVLGLSRQLTKQYRNRRSKFAIGSRYRYFGSCISYLVSIVSR